MMRSLKSLIWLPLFYSTLVTEDAWAQRPAELRIYQTDSVGNIRYHAPSWTVQSDGRVIETNSYGVKLYHRQQYKIVGNQSVPIDSVGNPQPHKNVTVRR